MQTVSEKSVSDNLKDDLVFRHSGSGFGRLRQEEFFKCKVNLVYTVNSKSILSIVICYLYKQTGKKIVSLENEFLMSFF